MTITRQADRSVSWESIKHRRHEVPAEFAERIHTYEREELFALERCATAP
jgi:hypothetical protein